ncbi:MAG: ABC transporter substrate-binding protein [Rhodopila sp.]
MAPAWADTAGRSLHHSVTAPGRMHIPGCSQAGTGIVKTASKGKTIAVRASGDATDIATRVLLKREGLDPDKDVTILAVQQEGARMASLMAGQICCTVAQVQDRMLLEKNGFHMLFDMTTLGIPNAQGVIATSRAYAKDHSDVIQHFMDSLVESIGRSKKDKPGAPCRC